ncbi:hypothetical protein A2U01_0105823, partial [Trifolium medium]|nr:hypothetical protein [Trifolium medium]
MSPPPRLATDSDTRSVSLASTGVTSDNWRQGTSRTAPGDMEPRL